MSQFIEMVGDPRNNPKGWPTKRLSELAEYSIGLTYKPEQICGDGTIVLRSGNIQDGKISFLDIIRVNAPIKESLFVKEDDILMCSRNGSASLVGKVAMIPDINEPMTFGAFMTIIRSAEAKYLYLYFQSQDFRERVSEGKSSTMNQITQKMLDKVEVPFPDKDVRETLSAIASQADKSEFVGCKSQFIEMFGNPLSLNQKNELKRLGECCILNPRRPNIALCDTDKVSFIPMPAVSEDGYLVDMTDEEYGKVKKGFTYFENNDVLFAKITPCMENGKGAIVHGLTNGIGMGSTEFHVLRPINGISSPYWLLALTRMPIFRERAAKNMSGTGGQKRVSASYLDHFMVGLPAIEEQRRFEAIYKQADKSEYYN
ncbi:restriction endonuclease subunit S [Bacteroides acidifaciens]|uniref:restriction endonuclease subunit S n=1 Tax=Bacteroides acidifaciens TaxID=85831 RepID=UPI0025A51DA7|nr:restriction endonuclease subunit S [Bacteroides acidifaciens]